MATGRCHPVVTGLARAAKGRPGWPSRVVTAAWTVQFGVTRPTIYRHLAKQTV